MKRKIVAFLLVLSLAAALLPVSFAEEDDMDMTFSPADPVQGQDKTDEENGDQSDFDAIKDANSSIMEGLGKKDWENLADKVKLTGKWRDDLVQLAQTQIGYQEEKTGVTLYTRWAGKDAGADWTALFVNWVAAKAGLDDHDFPKGETYDEFRSQMKKLSAVKKISRSTYPTSGDLALIESGKQKLVGIVVYVSNDYASVIHGDDNGRVTKETYQVGGREFKYYIDLNVLMERAGIEVGKGGVVPVIPEGGIAAWTNTNAVYLRSEPTTACKSLTTVKKAKTAVLVTSAVMQEDGYIWYGVEYKNYQGFIRGDLLNLDVSAIPEVTPIPEAKPEPTPVPGCALCNGASQGLTLPVECCYEHLAGMTADEAAAFMDELRRDDPFTYTLYINCTGAHVNAGAAEVLCLGDACGQAAWAAPSALHSADCPWFKSGLEIQERVVNIVVNQPASVDGVLPGQEVTFTFEVYGAEAYQWFEVESVAEGNEKANMLDGETGTTLTVVANDETVGRSYYCEAYLQKDVGTSAVTSKRVQLNVTAPIAAEAIVGEAVYFTYHYEGAASYKWYVKENSATSAVEVETTSTALLSLTASVDDAGKIYYCVAQDQDGQELAKSVYYTYTISYDLSKYVNELANLSRAERFTLMTKVWANVTVKVGEDEKPLNIAVFNEWTRKYRTTYPTLLCTCNNFYAPGDNRHAKKCPWHTESATKPSKNERVEADVCSSYKNKLPAEVICAYEFLKGLGDSAARYAYLAELKQQNPAGYAAFMESYDKHIAAGAEALIQTSGYLEEQLSNPEFAQWAESATPEMIARALTVKSLDHVALEANGDGTYTLYVVRYAEPVGSVDARGFLAVKLPGTNDELVIGWIDFKENIVYFNNEKKPDYAPAYSAN